MADIETGSLGVGLDVTIKSVADERSAKAAGEKIANTVAKEVLKTLGEISDFKFSGASSVPTMQAIKVKLAQTAQALSSEQQGLLVDYARVLEETYQELVKIRQAKGKKPRLSGDNEKALELLRGAVEDLLNMPLSGVSKDLENMAVTVNSTVTAMKQLRTALLRSTPKGADASVKSSVNAVYESFRAIDALNAQIVKQFDSVANIKIGNYKATTLTQNLGVKMQANAVKLGTTVEAGIAKYAEAASESALEQMQVLDTLISRHMSEATRLRLQEFKAPASSDFLNKVKRAAATAGSRLHMDFEFDGNEIISATIGNLTASTTLINERFKDIINNSNSTFLKDKVLPGVERQLERGSQGYNTVEVLPAQALAKRLIEEAELAASVGQTIGTWGMSIAEKPVLQAFTRKYSKEDVQRVEGLFKSKAIVDVMGLFGKLTGMTGYKGQSLAEAYMLFFKTQLEGHHTSSDDVMAGSLIDTVMRSPDLLTEALTLTPEQKTDFITYVLKNGLDGLRTATQNMDLASLAKRYGVKGALEPAGMINAVLDYLNQATQALYDGIESGKVLGGFEDPAAIERIIAKHEGGKAPKIDKSIAAVSITVDNAFAHLLDTTAMHIYDTIASNTKGLNVAKLVRLITGPTEDFFQQAALGYSDSVQIDTKTAAARTVGAIKQAAQAVSALTQIDDDGAIKGHLPEVKKALQAIPLIWVEAAKQTTAGMVGDAKFDASHVRLPTAVPFSDYQADYAEAEAFFNTDSSRSKGLKAITELIARGVSAFDIGRVLRDELKITDVLPKSTNWPNLVESMGAAKRGLDWEEDAIKFLEADGWTVMRTKGKTEQETSLGGISGHPDVLAWHPEHGLRIMDLKYYGAKNTATLESGGTPVGAAYQTNGYGLSLDSSARQVVQGLAIVVPKLDAASGALVGVTTHLREFDAAIEKRIATTVAAATGRPAAALHDPRFSKAVQDFAASTTGNISITPSSHFDPATLIRNTAADVINDLFTRYIDVAKKQGVSGIDRLIRDTARVGLGEQATESVDRPVMDKLAVLALQLGTSLEQLVASVVDAKVALDSSGVQNVDKADVFDKQLSARLIGNVQPSTEAQQYVDQKLLTYRTAIADMQATSEAAKQYRNNAINSGGGSNVEVLGPGAAPVERGFETQYSADIAAINVKESTYGKSFETLQSRATAARKEVERVVKLMSTSVGSTFLSEPEKEFNEYTKQMQQLIAQVEYFDKLAMAKVNKGVEWTAIEASTRFQLQDKTLKKDTRETLNDQLEKAIRGRQEAGLQAAAFQAKADELRGTLVDKAHSTEYKAWAESDVAKPAKVVTDENIANAIKDVENAKAAINKKLENDYVRIRAQLYVEPNDIANLKAAIQQSFAAADAGVTSRFSAEELFTRLGASSPTPISEVGQSSTMSAVLQAEQIAKLRGEDSLAALTGPRDAMKQVVKAIQAELASLGSTTAVTKIGQEAANLDKELQQGAQHVKALNAGIAEISKLPDFDKDGKAYNALLEKRDKLLADLIAKEKQMRELAGQFKVDFFAPEALDRAKIDAADRETQRLERLQQEKVMLDATLGTTADKDALKRNYKLTQQLENEFGDLPDHLASSKDVAAQATSKGIEVGEKGRHAKDFAGQIIDLGMWQVQWGIAGQVNELAMSFTKGLTAAREFNKEMTEVNWIMQADTAESADLERSIYNLSTTFAYSPTELSDGLIILGQAGFKASEALQMLPGVAALATATMATLGQSTDILTTTIEAFDIPTSMSDKLSNTLAAITIESKLDLDKLGTTLNYVASTAATTGLSIEDTGTAMGLMANAGIRASTIGTSLRSVLGALLAPTADFKNELARLGITAEEVNPMYNDFGSILRKLHSAGFDTEKAFATLDKRVANGIVVLMEQSDQWDEFKGKITGTQRAFTGAEAQMNTYESQLKRVGSALKLLGVDVFRPATESGIGFLKVLGDITSGLAGFLHTATTGTSGNVLNPMLSLVTTVTALTTVSSLTAGLLSGLRSIRNEALNAKEPTPLQNSLLSMRSMFWDPKLLKINTGIALATTLGSIAYDQLSGEAGYRSAVRDRDTTSSTLSTLSTYKDQYDKAAPGGAEQAMVKDNVNRLVDSIGSFYDGINEILAPLKDDISYIDTALNRLKALKLQQEKDVIKAEVEKATGTWPTFFNALSRHARAFFSLDMVERLFTPKSFATPNPYDDVDKARFNKQAESFVSTLKSQGKFYADDETYNAGVQALLPSKDPSEPGAAEASEIRSRMDKLRTDALAEPDLVKKFESDSRIRLKRAVSELEINQAELKRLTDVYNSEPQFEQDPVTGMYRPKDDPALGKAKAAVAASEKELQDASSKFMDAKGAAANDLYVYSISGLKKTLDEQMASLKQQADTMNDMSQPEGVRAVAKEQFDALMPAAAAKLQTFLVRSFYAKLGKGISATQGAMAGQLRDTVAYGSEEDVVATAMVPISMRGDMLESLTKLTDKYTKRWQAAGDEMQKNPAFKRALIAEYKVDIAENLDDFRKKAADRAEKYYKIMQDAWDKVSAQKVTNLGLNLDRRELDRQDAKEDALLALRRGPINLARQFSTATDNGYKPNASYIPIAAYSKEQETLIELAAQHRSTLDGMMTKAKQYTEEMRNNASKLEELQAHYKAAYGGVITTDDALRLTTEEQKLTDAKLKIQQDYIKNVQDLLKKEYDIRRQAADAILSIERQMNESIADLHKTINSPNGEDKKNLAGTDLMQRINSAWRVLSDAGSHNNTQGVVDSTKIINDLIAKVYASPDFSDEQKANLRSGLFTKIEHDAAQAKDSAIAPFKDQLSTSDNTIAVLKAQRKAQWDALMGKPESYASVTDAITGRTIQQYTPAVKGTISEAQRLQFEAQGMTEEKYINAVDAINTDPKTIQDAVDIAAKNLDILSDQFKTAAEVYAEATELLRKSAGLPAADSNQTMQNYAGFKSMNNKPLQDLNLRVEGQIKLLGADGKGAELSEEQFKAVADKVSYALIKQLNSLGA